MTTSSPTALQPVTSLRSVPDSLNYRTRRASTQSDTSQQIEAAPAYVISWNTQQCTRTSLSTVDELRTEIQRGKADHVERLIVVHGLPVDYVKALRNSLDIDPSFLEAHAGRRRYRPLRWRKEATFAHFQYPELVSGYRAVGMGEAAMVDKGGRDVDLMGDPAVRGVSEDGDTAAAFCHASLWINSQADVLFLDRPVWADLTSPLRKARRDASVTKPYQLRSAYDRKSSLEIRLAEGDAIGSLEDDLYSALKDAADVGEGLTDIVAGLMYDHWLEFFEILSPHPQTTIGCDTSVFYWEIAQSLEQNLAHTHYISRRTPQMQSNLDWNALLSRLQRRISLLPPSKTRPSASKSLTGKKISRQGTLASSAHSSSKRSHANSQPEEENQRALNRVSYLGGILLPFSLVSGILSMSDPFGPENHMFWVFWAAAIPLTLISILIIYADIIRKAEVWVEVAAEGVSEAIAQAASVSAPARVETDTQRRATLTWYRLSKLDAGQAPQTKTKTNGKLPEIFPYSSGDEAVVIDMVPSTEDLEQPPLDIDDTEREDIEPTMILERPSDGSKPKAWKRQQLGWYGAVKAIVGYNKPRRETPFGIATFEPSKRRTF